MKQKLTISLTGEQAINELEELRLQLEKRLKQRLSIAQVVRRLVKIGLEQETALEQWSKAAE